MADFKIAFKLTGKIEKGYTDDPDDAGNWTGGVIGLGTLVGTKFGFSAPLLKKWLGREPLKSEMENLTEDVPEKAFKVWYWDVCRGDEINDQKAANKIYDMAINASCKESINECQIALGIHVTGKMDDRTLNELNA